MTSWVYVPAPPAHARLTARVSHTENPPVTLGPHQAQPDAWPADAANRQRQRPTDGDRDCRTVSS